MHEEPRSTIQQPQRDAGVSDSTWHQLQASIQANILAEKQRLDELNQIEESTKLLDEAEEAAEKEAKVTEEAIELSLDDDEEDDLRRRHEQARLKALEMMRQKQETEKKLRLARLEQERLRKREMQAQQKLREMGVCPVGYRWIKQGGGYRCAGGSHFVSDAMIGL